MPWSFEEDRPIFQQIVDVITERILCGEYKAGDKLPAVRDFAIEAGVNPNTMQRALTQVEQTGLIFTKRGDGRYIAEDNEAADRIRHEYVKRNVASFVSGLKALGLEDEQILKTVSDELNK